MTKRQATFAVTCLSVWFAISSAVGGGFLNYHFTLVGSAFMASGIFALPLSLQITFRHIYPHGYRLVWWPPIIGFLACNCVILIAVAALSMIPVPNPPTFRVPGSSGLVLNPASRGFGPVVASNGTTMYTVDRFVFVGLVNLLQVRRTIQGYALEITQPNGVVVRACHLDLRQLRVYWIFQPPEAATAQELDVDHLDERLANGIEPGAEVSGWSAWECPQAICPRGDMRMVILDVQGNREIVPLTAKPAPSDPSQLLPQPSLGLLPKVPITSLGVLDRCR